MITAWRESEYFPLPFLSTKGASCFHFAADSLSSRKSMWSDDCVGNAVCNNNDKTHQWQQNGHEERHQWQNNGDDKTHHWHNTGNEEHHQWQNNGDDKHISGTYAALRDLVKSKGKITDLQWQNNGDDEHISGTTPAMKNDISGSITTMKYISMTQHRQ
mgnify:CR=1 FL=1